MLKKTYLVSVSRGAAIRNAVIPTRVRRRPAPGRRVDDEQPQKESRFTTPHSPTDLPRVRSMVLAVRA